MKHSANMVKPPIDELIHWYEGGELKPLAHWLPHMPRKGDPFLEFLFASNLLKMGSHLDKPAVTWGADPEFILFVGVSGSDIALFSSEFTSNYFGMSEAEIGADYGLLEFRVKPTEVIAGLANSVLGLHNEFEGRFKDGKGRKLKILEKEAVRFDHRRERVRQELNKSKDINYGGNRGKDTYVMSSGGATTRYAGGANSVMVAGLETGETLSAYDRPTFGQWDDKMLTAGGHIHVGGSLIKMLSFEQVKAFVRKLDKNVLPVCNSVETEAGDLRRTVYGQPGEFRIKAHGIEYRSPSNAIFFKRNLEKLGEVLGTTLSILNSMATEGK